VEAASAFTPDLAGPDQTCEIVTFFPVEQMNPHSGAIGLLT
jgi:hypothetical protein